jgi:hypothetical protein
VGISRASVAEVKILFFRLGNEPTTNDTSSWKTKFQRFVELVEDKGLDRINGNISTADMISQAAGCPYQQGWWLNQIIFLYFPLVAAIAAGYFKARAHCFKNLFYL